MWLYKIRFKTDHVIVWVKFKILLQVISVVPQMQFFKLDPKWEFVVVGSDGIWDAMSNQEMSNYIKVYCIYMHISGSK